MDEFKKKWFQIVWACLLIVSITITYIQRMSDALWVHSAAMEMLGKVLDWIVMPMTLFLFIWLCIGYWRQSERLFWRVWRRWGGALAIGVVCAAALVMLVRYVKGDRTAIDEDIRALFLGVFSAAGLIYAIARYKFNHWRKEDE